MDISNQNLSVDIFTGLLQYLQKNTAFLVKKLGGRKKNCQDLFQARGGLMQSAHFLSAIEKS